MSEPTLVLQGKVAREVERRALLGVHPKSRYKRRQMIRLVMRDGKCCSYCQRPLRMPWEPGYKQNAHNAATYDHVKTKSSGGRRSLENGNLACYTCNNLRGVQRLEKFIARLEAAGCDPLVLRAQVKKDAQRRRQVHMEKRQLKSVNRFNRRVDATLDHLQSYDHLGPLDQFVHRLVYWLTSWSRYAIVLP